MAVDVSTLDRGYVVRGGDPIWHVPGYAETDQITVDDLKRVVDYDLAKLPTFTGAEHGGVPTGGYCIARMDTPNPTVLVPGVGERYALLDRRELIRSFEEGLLAEYPLRIAGCGTFQQGACFFVQFEAARYGIKGDRSPQELLVTYTETLGKTSHSVFASHRRVSCQNTLKMAKSEALVSGLFLNHRHTVGAEVKLNKTAEIFAELYLQLKRDRAQMTHLTQRPATDKTVKAFLASMLPEPLPVPGKEEASTKAMNRWREAVETVWRNWHLGENMDSPTAHSRYGLLQAWTAYIDHASYSKSKFDRWLDGLNGERANRKTEAANWLLAA